jgi:hypothetical protein
MKEILNCDLCEYKTPDRENCHPYYKNISIDVYQALACMTLFHHMKETHFPSGDLDCAIRKTIFDKVKE